MLEGKRRGASGGHSRYLLRSVLFLLVLTGLAVVFRETLLGGFNANRVLNGLILGVLAFGILYTFQALVGVYLTSRAASRATVIVEEVQNGTKPPEQATEVLLSPSQRGLADFLHTVHRVLRHADATATLPYLLDSLAARGEDRRALVRYLTSALVLLGLIGTFFGLLVTIDGVREVLGGLGEDGDTDTMALLTGLRERLATPLRGMGLAFSSSLFGLLASLILAFMELQLFHAQNDVHGRLETLVVGDLVPMWQRVRRPMAGTGTQLAMAAAPASPTYLHSLLDSTAERLDQVVRLLESQAQQDGTRRLGEHVAGLNERIESLRETLETLERDRSADLRHELRLMARTLARDKVGDAPST